MAILKSKDIARMSEGEIEEKIKELKREIIKSRINLGKGGKSRIKEMKKTIAKLLTFNRLNKNLSKDFHKN